MGSPVGLAWAGNNYNDQHWLLYDFVLGRVPSPLPWAGPFKPYNHPKAHSIVLSPILQINKLRWKELPEVPQPVASDFITSVQSHLHGRAWVTG